MTLKCPHCGMRNDRLESLDPVMAPTPKPGNVSLCAGCGRFSMFDLVDGTLGIRHANVEENNRINADPECIKAMSAWMTAKEKQRAARSPQGPDTFLDAAFPSEAPNDYRR